MLSFRSSRREARPQRNAESILMTAEKKSSSWKSKAGKLKSPTTPSHTRIKAALSYCILSWMEQSIGEQRLSHIAKAEDNSERKSQSPTALDPTTSSISPNRRTQNPMHVMERRHICQDEINLPACTVLDNQGPDFGLSCEDFIRGLRLLAASRKQPVPDASLTASQ